MSKIFNDSDFLRICYLLCHHPELSVGDIAEVLGLSISAVSHALSKLKKFGVVQGRKDYKQIFYSLKKTKLTEYIKESFFASQKVDGDINNKKYPKVSLPRIVSRAA